MALVREEAVRVALDLLDEVGLDGLSLRRLAARLGVQAPTLYWHFKNKQDLIDEMATTMMAANPLEPPTEVAWDQWLAWMASGTYAALRGHRDGPLLVARRSRREAEADEAIVAMLRAAGFSHSAAVRSMDVLADYVLGAALADRPAEPGIQLVVAGMRAGL